MMAASTALAIPELLEAILLSLPTQDILFAQRVNTFFHATIRNSIHLRRELFFEPEPASKDPDRWGWKNPLVDERINISTTCSIWVSSRHVWRREDGKTYLNVYCDSATPGLKTHEHGSWRDMYAANPPCGFRILDRLLNPVFPDHIPACTMGEVADRLKDKDVSGLKHRAV